MLNTAANNSPTTFKRESRSLECGIAAYSTCRMSPDDVNKLRKQSDAIPGQLGNSTLRHADEQTLAALAAVQIAVKQMDGTTNDFQNWGVVGSSRYLGRQAFAQSLTRFAAEGPWNVSVQIVPNRSLHSPPSMVGLALGCHGPCVGVGGGLDGETDGWITAVSLLEQHHLSGLFLLFSGWDPDEEVDLEGKQLNDAHCTAGVLALQPASATSNIATLKIGYHASAPKQIEVPAPTTAFHSIQQFAEGGIDAGLKSIHLGGGLRADLEWLPSVISKLPMPNAAPNPIKKVA